MSIDFEVPGYQPPPNGRRPETQYNNVGAGYFEMLRMPIVTGRSFTDQDRQGAPLVAVINETMARQYWPGESAVGKQVRRGEKLIEIVGVVRDSKYERIDEKPIAVWYLPFAQNYSPQMMVHARTARSGAATLAAIRREVRALDLNVPVQEALPMPALIGLTLFPQRVAAVLVGIFGMVGLLLAAVGLYGILAYHVGQRTQEIGIRMALGAATGDVMRMVVRHGAKLTAIGLGIGLVAAFGLTRLLSGLLFGISATDPVTFVAMPLLPMLVAFVAAYLPARRATRVDPMVALRSE
jgi:predicted permease